MVNTVADTAAALARALDAPWWLALGVLLHLLNQVTRGRGWWAILRPACDHDPQLRRRDAIAAWMAGAAAAGVTFARGGDAVRVLLLGRRVPQVPASVLAGTLVAEGAGELAGGLTLIPVAVAFGAVPVGHAVPMALGVAALFAVAAGLARRRRASADEATGWRGRAARLLARVGCGCSALPPGAFVRRVSPWQFASRGCRLAALGCFLAAFGLPVTPAAIVLVVFAQGGGRLVPFAPASVGAGAAMLAAAFQPVTGTHVPTADVTAFFLGTSAVLTVVGTLVATAICLRAAQASQKTGWSWRLMGRRTRTRVAAAPRT
jgi:uncharacterized membrane protein YbhN (UPF0104 family)